MGKFSITGNRTHVWKLFPNYLIHLVKADFMFQTILCKLPGSNQFPFIAKKGVSPLPVRYGTDKWLRQAGLLECHNLRLF